MGDLETLRPAVRSALGAMVRADVCRDSVPTDAFDIIRAELLRLANENARMRGIIETLDTAGQRRADRAEAELAALKARLAKCEEWARGGALNRS